jgi:hypothetical protein
VSEERSSPGNGKSMLASVELGDETALGKAADKKKKKKKAKEKGV